MALPGVCMSILNARNTKNGYGTFAKPEPFLNQDYERLKQYCLIQGVRFIDKMFPPDKTSIGGDVLEPADLSRVEWLRPAKLVPNPSFEAGEISRFDFGQGIVGNCWFLASIGSLTFQKQIFQQVVPLEQRFDKKYCGLFHFRFWRFGKWVDVVIDDKLPTINGQLIFVHSSDPTVFWPALLEKAYAKVCGSYSDMNSGTPDEALVDFTGGVHMCIELQDPPGDLWEQMCRAGQFKCLMGCGTTQGDSAGNAVLPNGLVQGHAYAVTGVKQMMSNGTPVQLVRLWNPWGATEWNGAWSDESRLWQTVSPEDRESCLAMRDDGEFWMTLEDFCKFYLLLDICCLYPNFLDGDSSCHWKTTFYEGRWVAGTTAGGSMNNASFWSNPQYRIQIAGEYSGRDDEKNLLVSLMQKPDKRNRRMVQNLYIGFIVFEFKAQRGKFPAAFFRRNRPVAQSKGYKNAREVMAFFALKSGEYLIVPLNPTPNETASFILTIVSKGETHVQENSGGHGDVQHDIQENGEEDEKKRTMSRQYSDMYEEVDAEKLQRLLNEHILKGDMKSGGFSIDACRSMVALMDTSITGKLNDEEFVHLWNKVVGYKDVFFRSDVSQTGTLSLIELRNAITASGNTINDEILNLMALRYGASSGHITLESFISLILRFDRVNQIFRHLSNGKDMTLREPEWLSLSMYT
uniref:Uncharacterized protein n=1 Tax=Gasterosteus aculeatus aculeatus TaxID=481459 RepID=G3NQ89_GASAC